MQNLEQLSRSLESGGKGDALRRLAGTPEGARVAGSAEAAALSDAMRRGDTEAMRRGLAALLRSDDGRRLAEHIRRALED